MDSGFDEVYIWLVDGREILVTKVHQKNNEEES